MSENPVRDLLDQIPRTEKIDQVARPLRQAAEKIAETPGLSEASVAELLRNQVAAYDTSRDYSVGITGIPRYALGAWPDVVAADGSSVVVSGNGGKGFYPWVDLEHRAYGIVGIQDDRGAELAVPASQRVAVAARQAYGGR